MRRWITVALLLVLLVPLSALADFKDVTLGTISEFQQ